jgi:hypothetical protein
LYVSGVTSISLPFVSPRSGSLRGDTHNVLTVVPNA